MDATLFFIVALTLLAVIAGFVVFSRCHCTGPKSSATHSRTNDNSESPAANHSSSSDVYKGKHNKKSRPPFKTHQKQQDARDTEPQVAAQNKELFVDFVKGVNKHVDCIAIAPHAHLIATTTADAKVHVALDAASTYFLNFREDTFSALDFWCKERQSESSAYLCGAMATEGRLVCFEIKHRDRKVTGIHEVRRSALPLQKGMVTHLVASKAPWIVTSSEGDDTEIRVHSYEGDLLATVDTKQVQNLQLSVSSDGCFFGCAAWAPGVKIFEVKAKGGSFQKVEKAMDLRSSQGLLAFAISPDRNRAAIVDKSGSLSLWRIDVMHKVGEEPKMMCQTSVPSSSTASTSLQGIEGFLLLLRTDFTLDGAVLIVATGPHLQFFHAATLEMYKSVEHATSSPIQHLLVAPNNKFLLLCSEGCRPVIWRLPLRTA